MAPSPAGRFCWLDLAATDASRAIEFYAALFGWSARAQCANGGTFMRLVRDGRDIGSLYQMRRSAREAGIASHWTPYVQVGDLQAATRLAATLGGSIAVEPLTVEGMARIALVVDPVGATFGLWEALPRA
jgi:uncharacterized protein